MGLCKVRVNRWGNNYVLKVRYSECLKWNGRCCKDTKITNRRGMGWKGIWPAFSVKLPVPHGPPNAGQRGDCTHSIQLGWGCIVPILHELADATLGQPMLYCTCTAWVSQGYIVPIPHGLAEVIYTWQPSPYVSPAHFGNSFTYIWYVAYHICLGLIFQYKFNHDVCFVIGLPNLAIVSGILDMEHIIYVWDLFFNMNSTMMFVLWSDYLIW
jgi:hypothetical protein